MHDADHIIFQWAGRSRKKMATNIISLTWLQGLTGVPLSYFFFPLFIVVLFETHKLPGHDNDVFSVSKFRKEYALYKFILEFFNPGTLSW